jgi:hypothetical protein
MRLCLHKRPNTSSFKRSTAFAGSGAYNSAFAFYILLPLLCLRLRLLPLTSQHLDLASMPEFTKSRIRSNIVNYTKIASWELQMRRQRWQIVTGKSWKRSGSGGTMQDGNLHRGSSGRVAVLRHILHLPLPLLQSLVPSRCKPIFPPLSISFPSPVLRRSPPRPSAFSS